MPILRRAQDDTHEVTFAKYCWDTAPAHASGEQLAFAVPGRSCICACRGSVAPTSSLPKNSRATMAASRLKNAAESTFNDGEQAAV